jgi:uncharacterized repeat protein (TIGR02543 family)
LSTNGNAKKRKLTRLEEQCPKFTDNNPIDEKLKSTVKFFKTSKAESGKRYSMPRKRTSSMKLKLKSRNLVMFFVLAVFMLCVLFTSNSDVLSAYFTDIKNLNNAFSVDAEYTVTFDSNTGTGTMPAQIVSYNVATPLNANTFTKTDYVFTGWNTNANGTGTAYAPGAPITNLGDIILYAQWIESTNCTVTYVYGDATFDGSNYINSGIPLFSSDNIHRDFEVKSTISNFTVNAGQNQNRNVLICNQNEAANTYPGFALSYREDKDIDGGKAIKIQGNCTSTGQAMVLWGKTAGTIVFTRTDEKLYYDDNNFLVDFANLVTPFSAPLTFGANLDKNGHPRRYAKATMSDTEVKITYSLSEIPTLALPTPTKTGYIFAGWYTEAVGGTRIITPSIEQLANKKIYAHWAEQNVSYSINFDSNGGTGTMGNQIIDYGVPTALTTNTFTKEGATFKGWNTLANGTGTHYDDEAVVTDLGDITLYAEWEELTYPITFCYGDENFTGNNYIDSGIGLFTPENINRDFELSLSFDNFQYIYNSEGRNTILSSHYEAAPPYQGFSFIYRDGKLKAQGNSKKRGEKYIDWENSTQGTIDFKREGTILTFNNQLLIDYSTIKGPFQDHLTFGANIWSGPPRRFADVDVSDITLTIEYTMSEFPLTTLPTPTRTGYIFDGWYTAETGGTQVTELSFSDYENAYNNDGYYKLYPHWTANP